ncbi:MAG TPA: hypothetical protein VKA10_11840, partial [Prolixibacteraceae bacterium]|nr:hypothetical protein [Prolixibacteraceae bacterium]
MKLGKYIKHLLPEHEIVIVPGFGALKTIDKPAEIDESGENIVPPSKEVAFYPEIKNNDGLLVSHVAQQENVSHFEALQLIEKERGEILYKIDKGEKVVLEGVGIFFLNESQKIVFEPVSGAAVSPDFFGLEPASLEKPGPIEKKPAGK